MAEGKGSWVRIPPWIIFLKGEDMDTLIVLGILIIGGYTFELCVKHFKKGWYFFAGVAGITTLAAAALVIDYMLYQAFIY